jgi:drug/metabolite transporter (DMT)-like permease
VRLLSTHDVNRSWPQLGGLVAVVACFYVASALGMAYVAGFDAVHRRLVHAQWWWLGPAFGAVLLAFCGYYFAYRGIKWARANRSSIRPLCWPL